MFISSTEKSIINARIDYLEKSVRELIKALAKDAVQPPEEKKRKGHVWTDASKVAASERMKKSWADRKAAKGVA
jgi:hypothetical protein